MKIYVVFGSTGRWDDCREWPVCAYFKRKQALKHVRKAQLYANKIFESKEKFPVELHQELVDWDLYGKHSIYDKNMEMDIWEGDTIEDPPTRYTIKTIEFFNEVPRNSVQKEFEKVLKIAKGNLETLNII